MLCRNAPFRPPAELCPASGHPSHHPDAAPFALAEECAAASREREKPMDALEIAEAKHRPVPTPAAIMRTERDRQLRLYVGEVGDERRGALGNGCGERR
jgi:hypothetical protein